MGTRADFYVGRGENAEWIGSTAYDGYPSGIDLTTTRKHKEFGFLGTMESEKFPEGAHLFDATDEPTFRARVAQYFENRKDVTLPERGWPWPWNTSSTTDFAYALDEGQVWASCFGGPWFDPREEPTDEEHEERERQDKAAVFPDMSERKNVAFGSDRSGSIIIAVPAGTLG